MCVLTWQSHSMLNFQKREQASALYVNVIWLQYCTFGAHHRMHYYSQLRVRFHDIPLYRAACSSENKSCMQDIDIHFVEGKRKDVERQSGRIDDAEKWWRRWKRGMKTAQHQPAHLSNYGMNGWQLFDKRLQIYSIMLRFSFNSIARSISPKAMLEWRKQEHKTTDAGMNKVKGNGEVGGG